MRVHNNSHGGNEITDRADNLIANSESDVGIALPR